MPAISKKSIFDIEPTVEVIPLPLTELRLRDIFAMTTVSALKYLAHHGLLRDGREEHENRDWAIVCPTCRNSPSMTLVASNDRSDGWVWRCPKCKKREKSIRDDSIFAGSKLDIVTCFALLYMWCNDYDNKYVMHELRLTDKPVTQWFARFRNICVDYGHNASKIGGPGKIMELDEMCLTHQKHHRGAPKPGTKVWYIAAVERGPRGRCFALQVDERDNETIDWVLRLYVADGTTLITDEWPAHVNIAQRLPDMNLHHFMIKHKEAYARWENVDEELARELGIETNSQGNRWLRVHTNTVEGLNSHLQHKIKRIRGTSLHYVNGYLAEAVFRLNARASLQQPIEAFVDLVAFEPVELRDEEEPQNADGGRWQLADPDAEAQEDEPDDEDTGTESEEDEQEDEDEE